MGARTRGFVERWRKERAGRIGLGKEGKSRVPMDQASNSFSFFLNLFSTKTKTN